MLIGLPPQLLVSSLRRNPRKRLMVAYLEVERLEVESMFNKNVIKLGDNKEYIKEAVDTVVILYIK